MSAGAAAVSVRSSVRDPRGRPWHLRPLETRRDLASKL